LTVVRLLTTADVDNRPPGSGVSVQARHEAVLADGRRVLLLDDRGWSSSGGWATTSAADVEETARVVVGPDEPVQGHTREDAEADHWAYLARILRRHGVRADAEDLARLPHDVVLGDRLRARIGHG
jgi:hypothetical protein